MKKIFLLLCIVSFFSCKDDDETIDYTTANDEEIQAYLSANNLNAQKSSSGLYYIIETIGSGDQPTISDNVTVAYKGYFTNGNVFDESDATGISFNLQQVIRGWQEGIAYFNEGGTGKLFIPSRLGYGTTDYNGIPGGSVLIFDIHLISIN